MVCGGNSAKGNWDTAVDTALTDRILSRCRRIEPRLVDAEVLGTIVGLRPARPSVRVEREQVGTQRVVHNYGHGGRPA